MKKILFFLLLIGLSSTNAQAQNRCNVSNVNNVYEFPMLYLEMNTLTITEVSIRARGKMACVASAKATARSDHTNQTDIIFNNGRMICAQRGDKERLIAAKLQPTLYNVLGTYLGIEDGAIILKNCIFLNV